MRRFILHNLNKTKSFDLNGLSAFAAEPTGLGNSFSPEYKESEKGKHLVNVTPSFEPISLKIYFNADGSSGYSNYKGLMTFLTECGTSPFMFEYDDGVTDKFCDVILKSHTKTEISEEGIFAETFTFERQTYFYERFEETFSLKNISMDKTRFPIGFPFGFFGKVFLKKKRVSNKFFVDAPVSIKISGQIKNDIVIYISTLDEKVVCETAVSVNNKEGTVITIEPTNKKITVEKDGVISNGYSLTDKTKNSFLYLPQGEYYIGSNLEDEDHGAVEISVKRYLLD